MKPAYVLVALSVAACGSSSASSAPDATPIEASARYFPIEVGARWDYEVNDNGTIGTKTQTVLALEDIGGQKAGIMAYKVQSLKPSGKLTLSWQEDTGSALIRHKEQSFAADQSPEAEEFYLPSKLRIDEIAEHLSAGASFAVTYDEEVEDFVAGGGVITNSKTETWTVEAVDVEVIVPAGTFQCIQMRKTNATAGSDKSYWFARGVGKVREEGALQSEELTAYSVP